MQNDTRSLSRSRTCIPAKIVFNNKQSVFDCLVRNITTNGACLKVPSRLGIPNQFTLIVPHEEKRYACWVVWGGLKEFGVSFTSAAPVTGKPILQIVKS